MSDLERSTHWYSRLFGTDPVLDEDEESGQFHHTVYALESGMLFGLHTDGFVGENGPQMSASSDRTRPPRP